MERFRRTFNGSIVSSLGYRVRVLDSMSVRYRSRLGTSQIVDALVWAQRSLAITIYVDAIVEDEDVSREIVIQRIVAALHVQKWKVTLEG